MTHQCSTKECTKKCYVKFEYCTKCRKNQQLKQCASPNCENNTYKVFCKLHCKQLNQCKHVMRTGENCPNLTPNEKCKLHSDKAKKYFAERKRIERLRLKSEKIIST